MRLKQELLSEVAKAADLPLVAGGNPASLRAALLGADSAAVGRVGIPAAVRVAPALATPIELPFPAPLPWTGGYPVATWATTYFEGTGGRGPP